MMDDMRGATILCLGKANLYSTISNVIDYMAPAKLEEVVTGKTEIIKLGQQIINVQFELWNMNKKRLLARGYSNNMKTEFLVPKLSPSVKTE
jgi:acyl-coenzyme A thioesterase PaaI-like protein